MAGGLESLRPLPNQAIVWFYGLSTSFHGFCQQLLQRIALNSKLLLPFPLAFINSSCIAPLVNTIPVRISVYLWYRCPLAGTDRGLYIKIMKSKFWGTAIDEESQRVATGSLKSASCRRKWQKFPVYALPSLIAQSKWAVRHETWVIFSTSQSLVS